MINLTYGRTFNTNSYRFTEVVFLCENLMLKSDNLLCVTNGEL